MTYDARELDLRSFRIWEARRPFYSTAAVQPRALAMAARLARAERIKIEIADEAKTQVSWQIILVNGEPR